MRIQPRIEQLLKRLDTPDLAFAILAFSIVSLVLPMRTAFAIEVDDKAFRMDIRLMGADLVDEMAYSWIQVPPFTERRNVALAEVVAPLGLDDRFQMMVENRLYEVLMLNAQIPFVLTRCSVCNRMVVKSSPQGTILSQGASEFLCLIV